MQQIRMLRNDWLVLVLEAYIDTHLCKRQNFPSTPTNTATKLDAPHAPPRRPNRTRTAMKMNILKQPSASRRIAPPSRRCATCPQPAGPGRTGPQPSRLVRLKHFHWFGAPDVPHCDHPLLRGNRKLGSISRKGSRERRRERVRWKPKG